MQHSKDVGMWAGIEFATDHVSVMFVEEVYEWANPFSVLAFDELEDTLVQLLDQETVELELSGVALWVVVDEVCEFLGFDGAFVL